MIAELYQWAAACDADFLTVKQFSKVKTPFEVVTKYEVEFMVSDRNNAYDFIHVYEEKKNVIEALRAELAEGTLQGRLFNKFFPVLVEEEDLGCL